MHWLLCLLACSGGGPAPDTRGVLLHAGPNTLVVQHDELIGRVVPGVDRYRFQDGAVPADLIAGQAVDLWVDGDTVTSLQVTGSASLPADFRPGGVPLVGTVINVDGTQVTIDHEPIDGVMGAMVMGFGLAPWEAERLHTGDRVKGSLLVSGYGWQLVDPTTTGKADATVRTDVEPLAIGEQLPRTTVVAEDGTELILGEGQGTVTALTYIYTRCPDPSFCPAIAARLAALQEQVDAGRIVTVTLDPDNDKPEVLAAWGSAMGADPTRWRLARADPVALQRLALFGGQHVTVKTGRISHLHRLLVLDAEGRLLERYDDNFWPMDRVAGQLRTGGPSAPAGAAGTKTPPPTAPAPSPAPRPR